MALLAEDEAIREFLVELDAPVQLIREVQPIQILPAHVLGLIYQQLGKQEFHWQLYKINEQKVMKLEHNYIEWGPLPRPLLSDKKSVATALNVSRIDTFPNQTISNSIN